MRILLVQTSFFGDLILSTPVIAALKKAHPKAELYLLTTVSGKALVERDPLVHAVLTFAKRGKEAGLFGLIRKARELRALRFDRVYSLHKSFRTALLLWFAGIPVRIGFKQARGSFLYTETRVRPAAEHDVLRNLSLVSQECPDAKTELRLFPPDRPSDLVLQELPKSSYAVVVPGSVWETKRYFAAGYRQVVEQLLAEGTAVVLVGAPEEKTICDEVGNGLPVVNLGGRTTLGDLLTIIAAASLVVCNDSMALHVASAFKVPTVTIFCATSPAFGFGPWQNNAVVVEHQNLPCKPCRRHGSHRCPLGTNRCMTEVSPESVLAAIHQVQRVEIEERA